MALKQRKRSFTEDSDESHNESKLAKLSANFWIYLKSNTRNLAQFVLKNPKTFERNLLEVDEGKDLDLNKLKFYLSKGIVRINCNDEKQQENCLKINKIGDIQVTATLPWMLSKTSETMESQPEKSSKIFKYVISSVSKEISENEIQNSISCKEATRISRPIDKSPVETETVILSFEKQQSLSCTVSIGYLKFKLKFTCHRQCVVKTACDWNTRLNTANIGRAVCIAG